MDDKRIYILLIKYSSNKLSASEYEELKSWLEASEENRILFRNYLSLNKKTMQYKALSRLDSEKAWQRYSTKRRFLQVRRWTLRYVGVVAVMIGLCWIVYSLFFTTDHIGETSLAELFPNHGCKQAVLISSEGPILSQVDSIFTWIDPSDKNIQSKDLQHYIYRKLSKMDHMNEVHVPRGGEYSLILADGTKVWLNAQSTLRFSYPFDSLRIVYLEGEAYFEVAHMSLPFEVHTDNNVIRVLGTSFNVRAYKEQPFQVSLVEGKVCVYNNQDRKNLLPDELLCEDADTGLYQTKQVNAKLYSAWTKGVFEFDNAPLNEIVYQLERWYDVEMEYVSEDLKDICFTGSILRKESLGYALEMIQKVSEVRFSKHENKVLIERK